MKREKIIELAIKTSTYSDSLNHPALLQKIHFHILLFRPLQSLECGKYKALELKLNLKGTKK